MADGWRLEHLRTQPYLRGVSFKRKTYKAYRPDWDHDHCAACWAKFAEQDSDCEPILREGFATTEDYERGEDYEWVCPSCFDLFRADMGWVEEAISCRAFLDAWPGSVLVLLIPVVPGAVLWWWGKSQIRRSVTNA